MTGGVSPFEVIFGGRSPCYQSKCVPRLAMKKMPPRADITGGRSTAAPATKRAKKGSFSGAASVASRVDKVRRIKEYVKRHLNSDINGNLSPRYTEGNLLFSSSTIFLAPPPGLQCRQMLM